jgi:hypothetical protein
MSTQKSRLSNTTLIVNATAEQLASPTSSAISIYGDVSMNSRLFVAGNTTTTGRLTGGSLYLQNSTVAQYNSSPINHFEQYTMIPRWATSTGNVGSEFSVYITRINNICHMTINGVYLVASGYNYYWMNILLPARFRPTRITFIPIVMEANNVHYYANLVLNTNGYVYAPITSGSSYSLSTSSLDMTDIDAGGSGTTYTIQWPTITYYIQ